MASGKIIKVVHLSLQSSGSADCSPQSKGYGFIEEAGSDTPVHFEARAVKGYSFDDLQLGQEVDFDKDPKLALAKSVTIAGEVLSPPSPKVDHPQL